MCAALSRGQMSAVPYSSEVLVLLRIIIAGPKVFGEELHVQQGLSQVTGMWPAPLRTSLSLRYINKLRFYVCSNSLIRSVFTTGDCPPCSMTSAKYCQCKKVREVRPCNEDVFQCQIVCGKAYGCGHHKCEQVRYTRFEIDSQNSY